MATTQDLEKQTFISSVSGSFSVEETSSPLKRFFSRKTLLFILKSLGKAIVIFAIVFEKLFM